MATLKTLEITNKVTEAIRVDAKSCAILVVTSEASNITVERSADGTNFSLIPDLTLAVNGTGEMNLIDIIEGQWLRVTSTGAITTCKILF